ncbi:MAG: hypothetical protein KDA21_01100 [Phycisphaerales bacterium]|nr:hypothetical protein [Phycisphaerales bacterium]
MDVVFLTQLGIALLLVLGLLLAVEVGFHIGGRVRGSDAGKAMESGAIQGAMLGLLGLLLGFSFAGASGRYMERQDLIPNEANAIGTAFLRADLLNPPFAAQLREALADYVDHRVEVSRTLRHGISADALAEVERDHARIWDAALQGVKDNPTATVSVLGPVNEVIDFHSRRIAAARKHLPGLVVGLLLVCSVLTLGVIGYASGLAHRRNTLMTSVIALLIAAALWTTIDLDRARIGLIQLSDQALHDLQAQLGSTTARPSD